jgi:hypothetical protein
MEDQNKAMDELLFIKKVIEDSRKIVVDNGMGFIVWGILITVGMLFGYIKFLLNLHFDYIWAWVVIIAAGWAFSFFKYYKKTSCKVETFAGRITGTLWFSFGISMSIVGFGGYFTGAVRGEYISSMMAVMLGAAYYISSVLYGWKWFKSVGILWWCGGIVMFNIAGMEQFLIMSGLMIFGQVIPGIIIYRKYKSQFEETK